jgi:hypothetical protein
MKTMIGFAAFALVCAAGNALATDISTVNSFKAETRLWNDFPTSSLTTTNSFPNVEFNETFPQGAVGNYANKHIAWLSNDSGASHFQNNYFQSWSMQFDVTINTAFGQGQPRKEAGIQVNNPRNPSIGGWTDEGQVLIASDGEVAVFGGAMPFTGFGNNTYTLGTTAHVTFSYFAPGAVDPIKGAYRLIFSDVVTGIHDSGLKIWGDESDFLYGLNNGCELGFKAQNQRNPFIEDNSDIAYGNFSIVPAPASIALVGLAGLTAGRRRR